MTFQTRNWLFRESRRRTNKNLNDQFTSKTDQTRSKVDVNGPNETLNFYCSLRNIPMNILKVLSASYYYDVNENCRCKVCKRQLPHLNIDSIELELFLLFQLLRFYGLSSWTCSYCAAPKTSTTDDLIDTKWKNQSDSKSDDRTAFRPTQSIQ